MESQFGKIHYEIPHFSVLNQNISYKKAASELPKTALYIGLKTFN